MVKGMIYIFGMIDGKPMPDAQGEPNGAPQG
jgi:hypothetical protein